MAVKKRVVVTGIGVVSSLGNTNDVFAERLLKGESGAGTITAFDPAELETRIAAQVDITELPIQMKDRKVAFGVSAAAFAVTDAGKTGDSLKEFYGENGRNGRGVSYGMGLELFSMPDMIQFRESGEPEAGGSVHPLTFLQTPSDMCVHMISRAQSLNLPPLTHISACAAATDAIGAAFRKIQMGQASWMIAGGADSMLNPMGVGGFCLLQAMTRRNDDPERASRPFDIDRDGFLLGEGSGAFILEEREQALERGAKIYGEIVGYGNSFDAYGISEPHPEGEGAELALRRALESGGVRPEQITHINAHGTSTPKNDPVETMAIRRLFGKAVDRILVNSTKSMIGHCISAAGALELAATFLCADKGFIHPLINLENPDPECELNFVRNQPAALAAGSENYILKNSFAFGGQNAALVLKV